MQKDATVTQDAKEILTREAKDLVARTARALLMSGYTGPQHQALREAVSAMAKYPDSDPCSWVVQEAYVVAMFSTDHTATLPLQKALERLNAIYAMHTV